MAHPPKPFFDLLRALFRANDDLLGFLATYPFDRMQDVTDALPAPSVPRSTFLLRAVEQLQANGLDSAAFFAALVERFPGQRQLIEAAMDNYLKDGRNNSDRADDMPLNDGSSIAPGLVTRFEKIMGDRPTFLDVSYLELGYQRAKSVAKLRMRYQNGWYSGTAFLVSPVTLLTAYHNLWNGEKRAEAVEVIFDYERSIDGADVESSVIAANPETFAGDAADDWALVKLDKPQLDRPLAPLAAKDSAVGDRVAIIQHPSGMLKQVALHHNLVTSAGGSRMQYLTDTLPGSSGSPVFDDQWKVVAVHHAGGELPEHGKQQTVYRNQGIPIRCVLEGMKARNLQF
ncbi:serine protease [Rhizobium ruizarguesonis]